MHPPACTVCLRPLALAGGLALALAAAVAWSEPPRPAPLSAEQKKQLQEVARLSAQAQKLQREGKLAPALAATEKALTLVRGLPGVGPQYLIDWLTYLASLREESADFAAARKDRQEILALGMKQWGAEHWRVTDARLALADTERLARLKPEERQQRAEAFRLNQQAIALAGQGKFRAALDAARQAFVLRRRVLGEQHPDCAQSLNNLAYLYEAQGDYAQAEPLSLQALALTKKALGENHPDYAISLNILATLYRAQGDYAQALPLYQKALAIRQQALGARHPAYATSLNNLAGLYQAQGDYARAEPLYQKALAIWKALGEHHPGYALSLNNLANLYHAQGDYAQAEPLFRQALAIRKQALGEHHPNYATSLDNLAGLYWAQGDHAQAGPLYRRALAIRKQALGERHPDYALSLNNLAGLYKAQGDYARAEPLFQKARAIWKKALGEHHPGYALSLNNLASLYQAQGDYAQAEPLFRQALAIRKRALGEHHPDYAISLNNLAVLYQAQEDHVQALPLLRQGLDIQRRNLDLAAAAQSERQQLAMTRDLRTTLDAYLSLAPRAKIAGGDAYRQVLAWKGAVFARQQHSGRLRRLLAQNKNPEVARLVSDLQHTASRLATLAFAVPVRAKRAPWQRQLEELSARKERLEKELVRTSAAFRAQRRRQALTPAQLQAALPRDAALIDFLEYTRYRRPSQGKGPFHRERHLAAFVIRPGRPIQQLDLGPLQPIHDAIDRWRQTRQRFRPLQGARDPAVTLRKLVWQPLGKDLNGIKTVLLSPDGALAGLPFAALPGKDPNRYLIEEVAVAVVPVPQLLPDLLASRTQVPENRRPAPTLLALGDVHYNAAPDQARAHGGGRPAARRAGALFRWPELDETRVEILAVRNSFKERFPTGRVRVLRQGQATAEALRRLAPRHRYLHLATHGFFAPPKLRSALAPDPRRHKGGAEFGLFDRHGVSGFHPGLLSGLVLAGANRPPQPDQDDGILTALEVADLNLENVELAVLSACETGLGVVAGGEGLLGLQRALQVAGAQSVVASLWKVDDKATRALMIRFYQNLWSNHPLAKLEALRQAQLWLLREGVQRGLVQRGLALREAKKARTRERTLRTPPLYWAAFQLSGDWR